MNKNKTYYILFTLLLMMMGVNSLFAQTYHTENYDYDGDGVQETYNVVYLNLSKGKYPSPGLSFSTLK